jgi:alpha-D-ribose 1-methylphosphonate 5-triphosphate diphosphatase
MTLPDLTLTGARVLTPGGLFDADLSLAGGRIVEGRGGPRVDLSGFLVLPGIVDIHGDGFERHLAPRRGALESLAAGLASFDAELAANGITTAVIAQFYSWEGGMRGPAFARDLVAALAGTTLRAETMVQLRLEVGMIDDFDDVLDLVDAGRIRYVVLNDHLPHKELAKGKRPPSLTGQALKARRSPEAHWEMLQAMHDRWGEVPGALGTALCGLAARGVLIGSHDDKTAEDRLRGRALGASVSEFPETRAAAEAARGRRGCDNGRAEPRAGRLACGEGGGGGLGGRGARGCVGLGLPLPVARTRRVSVGAGRDGFGSGLGACVGGTRAAVGVALTGGGWSRGCGRIWW